VVQTARKVSKRIRRYRKKQAKRGKISMIVGTLSSFSNIIYKI
jgi:hypothetical protein